MRTREEIEKKRDEVSEQIKKEYEWFKHFKKKGETKECNEIARWIMGDTTKLITLDWVLREVIGEGGSVAISKEAFEHLTNEKTFLTCLRNAGVESWEGYHTAQEMHEEERGEL